MLHRLFAKYASSDTAPTVSCARVQAKLFTFIDGELEKTEAQKIEAHLLTCTECRVEVARCRQSEQALRAAVQTTPSAGDLRAGFYAKLADTRQPPRLRWQPVGIALASMLALATVVPLLSARFAMGHPARTTVSAPEPMPVLSEPAVTMNTVVRPARLRTYATPGVSMRYAVAAPRHEVLLPHRQSRMAAATMHPLQLAEAPSPLPPHRRMLLDGVTTGFAAATKAVRDGVSRTSTLASAALAPPSVETTTEVPASSQEEETVLHVEDDVRGFTSNAHVASARGNAEGDSVISIDAEDSSTASTAPAPSQ